MIERHVRQGDTVNIKPLLKRAMNRLGFDIRRADPLGLDPFLDMYNLTPNKNDPVIFDVGANNGQSLQQFRSYFRNPEIHAFEPNADAFAELVRSTSGAAKVHVNNLGLGSKTGVRTFRENARTDMSSFLEKGADGFGVVQAIKNVQISTLAEYCAARGIGSIDILKTDTQGFDLEVLKGGDALLQSSAVRLILIEITFCALYEGIPRFDEIYGYLADRHFALVSFYKMWYRNGKAGWADALFIKALGQ
jgi:FkbM family methyltransferase